MGDSNNSSSRRICRYDVFLSFRGTDTRNTLMDHLYHLFIRKGIFAFKDDQTLQHGESISALLEAIKASRVSIVVFSKDYAASTWCLEEMATIAKCRKELKQAVIPVFYDVNPSHVRHQNGVYEVAFSSHSAKFKHDPGSKVDRWKSAMRDLANLVGWDVRDKPEVAGIEIIVQGVIKALGHKFSRAIINNNLIGIPSPVEEEELEKLLGLDSVVDVRVVGIRGMGGIGKVVYDRIFNRIDATCFIDDASKIYQDGGAVAVQKQIPHQALAVAVQKQIPRQALHEENLDTYSTHEISWIITNRLHRSIKVLLVLDNVDQLKQLQELAIDPKSLCKGSRIIITTRDEHLTEVPDAIGELKCLERLNVQGNNFDSLPWTINILRSLACLNFSHCHELRFFPELPLQNASSGGRYFKTESGSCDHRSGLYIFDCPKMKWSSIECLYFSNDIRQCLLRFVQEPWHFRCGFDIIVPWDWETNDSLGLIPLWFEHQFDGGSIIRIVQSNVDDNWLGFAFCVAFEVNNCPATSGSPHDSFSSSLPHPFYLSFESEHTEERFDMPLSLELDKIDGSKHLWLIYISREHCHFVKTGARITFKARSGLMIKKWGLHIQTNGEKEDDFLSSLPKFATKQQLLQLQLQWHQQLQQEQEQLLQRQQEQLQLLPRLQHKLRLQHELQQQRLLQQEHEHEKEQEKEMHMWLLRQQKNQQRLQRQQQWLQQLFDYVKTSSSSSGPNIQLPYVKESSSSSGPKIQLPYNWLVTEEEEVENYEAK